MTNEQLKSMSNEEIRIKVAELLDWTECQPASVTLDEPRGYNPAYADRVNPWRTVIPNFPEDLNACHDIEDTLTDIQFCKYVQILCGHTTTGERIQWTGPDAGRACRASARQRCDAFILTMTENSSCN